MVGAMTQIADRLQQRGDWPFPFVANIEPQLRIVLRQLHSVTLKEMAVSFPWPTREMAGAEVLPIRAMKPEEKTKWLSQLFGMLQHEQAKERPTTPKVPPPSPSSSRFEAPRQRPDSRPRTPSAGSSDLPLRRSNGTTRSSPPGRFRMNLAVPGVEPVPHGSVSSRSNSPRTFSPSPASSPPLDVGLGRMLSVNQRPGRAVLSDAMSLALFRVNDG